MRLGENREKTNVLILGGHASPVMKVGFGSLTHQARLEILGNGLSIEDNHV